jgi:hypothetical protein
VKGGLIAGSRESALGMMERGDFGGRALASRGRSRFLVALGMTERKAKAKAKASAEASAKASAEADYLRE